jgi:hypothetical protein
MKPSPIAIYRRGENTNYQKATNQSAFGESHVIEVKSEKAVRATKRQ